MLEYTLRKAVEEREAVNRQVIELLGNKEQLQYTYEALRQQFDTIIQVLKQGYPGLHDNLDNINEIFAGDKINPILTGAKQRRKARKKR
jgi:hypothetical protein